MKRFFITGTDTDCGKTWATCAMLSFFNATPTTAVSPAIEARKTRRALALKPVASGCILHNGELVSEDALHLQKYSGLPLQTINPWRYAMPVSPHIAARYEEKPLDFQKIADYCMEFSHPKAEYLFIEGAGGLMVPLTERYFWTDFLLETSIPVILVVGIKTGCINHALLTQEVLLQKGIVFAGWIANMLHQNVPAVSDNIVSLQQYLKAPLLGKIPYDSGLHPELAIHTL